MESKVRNLFITRGFILGVKGLKTSNPGMTASLFFRKSEVRNSKGRFFFFIFLLFFLNSNISKNRSAMRTCVAYHVKGARLSLINNSMRSYNNVATQFMKATHKLSDVKYDSVTPQVCESNENLCTRTWEASCKAAPPFLTSQWPVAVFFAPRDPPVDRCISPSCGSCCPQCLCF